MSAINPASFASPSLGLQAPSGIGPGAVGVSRSAQSERRQQLSDQSSYGGSTQSSRGYQGVFAQPFTSTVERSSMPPSVFQPSGYTFGYSPFGTAPRNASVSPSGYPPTMLQTIDPYSSFATPTEYQAIPARFPSPHGAAPTQEGTDYGRQGNGLGTTGEAWIGAFQGLSMNTR